LFDFRSALSSTGWDDLQGDIGSYLHVSPASRKHSSQTLVSISKTPTGSATAVLKFENTPSLNLTTLLSHSIV